MRAGLLALTVALAAACGPNVSTAPRAFEDDLDRDIASRPEAPRPTDAPRPTGAPRPTDASRPEAAADAPHLANAARPANATAPANAPRRAPAAPPGKGLRTGTIARARLVAVLDAGPGTFLRQLEVAPRMAGDRFVGWQLVQLLDRSGPLHEVDLAPGDVLLAINGKPVARPEQLQALWDSLRTANEVTAQLRRGDQPLELRFAVQPPVR